MSGGVFPENVPFASGRNCVYQARLNLLESRRRIYPICVLQRQTEGRVPVFSHEVVPDHLRTKPDPEVEEQEKQLTTDAARIGADAAQVGLRRCPPVPPQPLGSHHEKLDVAICVWWAHTVGYT